ncbi:hypothetical protein [Aquiflexum sp.]|uniref:hypothetical protein n=1 Tax=Aquiflexum sp. TaxID=1872584 RepID=UPI003593E18C
MQGFAQYSPPTQSVFVELGGPGLVYSFNYDFRFDKDRLDSWGLRVGAGGYARTNTWGGVKERNALLTVPVQATKLFGRSVHFFEVGGGATFIYFRDDFTGWNSNITQVRKDFDFILNSGNTPALMGTLNFGYRKIPVDGGFTFRANLIPVFNQNGFWPLWAGVGFGYAFH